MDLEDLEALLQRPSRRNWRSLCEVIDSIELIEPCQKLLEKNAWPDELRSLPGAWLRRLYNGEELPYLPLVTCLDAVQFESDKISPYAWANQVGLRNLTICKLYDEGFGDAGAEAFARSLYLGQVKKLMLSAGMTDRGAVTLASSKNLARVVTLNLQRNQIKRDGLHALVSSPYLKELHSLHLGRNTLDLEAVKALAAHRFALTRLDLDCTSMGGSMLEHLCESGALRGVKELNLSNNPIGRLGCEALAHCPELASLEILFLHNCGLDDGDVEVLLNSSTLGALQNLALSQNALTDKSVVLLAECGLLSGLTELDICHNPFSIEAAEERLRRSPALQQVRRLCV
jgi:Ran GTPase-activating protein (RanGAP) involved in mRNA processing and transport